MRVTVKAPVDAASVVITSRATGMESCRNPRVAVNIRTRAGGPCVEAGVTVPGVVDDDPPAQPAAADKTRTMRAARKNIAPL